MLAPDCVSTEQRTVHFTVYCDVAVSICRIASDLIDTNIHRGSHLATAKLSCVILTWRNLPTLRCLLYNTAVVCMRFSISEFQRQKREATIKLCTEFSTSQIRAQLNNYAYVCQRTKKTRAKDVFPNIHSTQAPEITSRQGRNGAVRC